MACKVYVVDESAQMRQTLAQVLRDDPDIEWMGCAANPRQAASAIRSKRPDVLLLDLGAPGAEGLRFVRRMREEMQIPTVICSAVVTQDSAMARDALAAGAVALMTRPRFQLTLFLEQARRELLKTLKAAAGAGPRAAAVVPVDLPLAAPRGSPSDRLVVVGGSTGGAQALESILQALPPDGPGIVVVQHMPARVTTAYAQRLDALCAVSVRQARDGDRIERGVVLIAPGGQQMQLRRNREHYCVAVSHSATRTPDKPSIDRLFRSAAECADHPVMAILLTGMGGDGARGMKQLHDGGAWTVVQDAATCVAFGMPGQAIGLGAVDAVLPVQQIAQAIRRFDSRP